jgi:acyl carrier protein
MAHLAPRPASASSCRTARFHQIKGTLPEGKERMTSNEAAVIQILQVIIESKQLPVPPITPGTALEARLGLESLDFAELVVRLEEATGKDPFANGDAPHIQTVSDLAALYDVSV